MQCSFCHLEKPVAEGPDVAICRECAMAAIADGTEIDDHCSFCGRRPGEPRGFLGVGAPPRQQPAGRVTICGECRKLALETLAH